MALLDHQEEHEEHGEHEPKPEHKAKLGTGADAGAPGTPAEKAKKQHRDNMILIVIAVVGVIVTYLIYRSNNANAAAANPTSATPVTNGNVAGYSGAGGGGGGGYDSMLSSLTTQEQANGQALAGLQTLLGNLGQELQTAASGPGASNGNGATNGPSPAAAANPGYGSIDIGGQSYDILGEAGSSSVYNVGGGAPVYFGNANSIAQGKQAEQTAVAQHGYEYVPAEYGSLIGSAPGAAAPGQPGYKAA
jgi:hypothetical protein